MFELWYAIVALMLGIYAVLDGFDFGVGILSPIVARTDAERRQVIAAIAPFWDANEVWLLAAGGGLFVAFPKVLASGVSGFYLAIFLVLWCLIGRGLALELRSHVGDRLWRAAFDFVFAAASTLLAVVTGAALGNLLRGVPLDAEGWFELPFFTDFTGREPVGILDWYTILAGVFALLVLASHGAHYLAWKTDGPVQERSVRLGRRLAVAVAVLWPAVTLASAAVNPDLFAGMRARPVAWLSTVVAVGGLVAALRRQRAGYHFAGFAGSAAFILGMLGAAAASYFPVMLRATGGAARSITAYTAGGDEAGLRTALGWFAIGFPLAISYFVVLFRLHRGKVVAGDREGH